MCTPERGDAEVEKDRDHTRRDPERSVVAGVRVGDGFAPEQGGEDHYGKEKKDSGNLEPENAAHAAEGTQKAAHTASHRSTGLAYGLPGLSGDVGLPTGQWRGSGG